MSTPAPETIDSTAEPEQRMTFPPPWLVPAACVVGLVGLIYCGYRYWEQRSIRLLGEACRAAVEAGDYARGEQIGRRWAEFEPDNSAILVQLAQAAKGQGAYDRMVKYLLRVPDGDPSALTMLGLAAEVQFNELVQPFGAEQTWLRILTIEPRANVPRKNLLYLYALTQQRAKLQSQVEEALRTESDTPDTYAYLLLMSDLQFTDAFPKLSNWLRQEPDSESLRVARALALANAPELSDPSVYSGSEYQPRDRTLLEECRRDFPQNLEARAYFIKHAIDLADADQLRPLLEGLPAAAEQDSRIWHARGWLLRAEGKPAEAEAALRKSLALYPLDWRVRHELSQVVRRLGRIEEAEQLAREAASGKSLQRAVLESPTTELAPEILARIAEYARDTGATAVAEPLSRRIGE
jgi:tetratricopeptide (TPR) repeat protein